MPSRSLVPFSHSKKAGMVATRILTCFLTVILVSQPTIAYEQEVKRLSAQMAESITKSGKKTVAVVDFTDLQGNVTELGRFLAEEFSVALTVAANDFEVIDRTHLKTLLQEHKLSSTGIIDPQTARRLGEIAGVQALVTGSITPFGDSVRVSAKVLDTATAKMIGAATADIPRTKAIEELLARGIGNSSNTGGTENSTRLTDSPGGHNENAPSIEQHHLLFVLRGCSRSGLTVSCAGSVTNKAEKRRGIMAMKGLHYSSAVDDIGNEHALSVVSFGRDGYMQLEPELPVNFSLSVENVAAAASRINIVLTYAGEYGDEAPMTGSGGAKAVFRNVLIQQK